MKNRRIELDLGKTINLGNFESKKISVGISVDIEDSDNLKKLMVELYDEVKDNLEEIEAKFNNKNSRRRFK